VHARLTTPEPGPGGRCATTRTGPRRVSAEQEATRQTVNAWVRTSRVFDGVADFDAAIRDPQDPTRVLPAYQADHLHPNIAGQRAMADSIDLGLFR
jgi:lysophospholipase L1-like esterase